MERYIKVSLLLQRLTGINSTIEQGIKYYNSVYNLIQEIPSADVAEVKHGEWIHEPPYYALNGKYLKSSECSNCHSVFVSDANEPYFDHPYCCECAAQMDRSKKK